MVDKNATSLYVKACKFLLCGEDRSSWDELVTLMPELRSALSCRVCRGLVSDPLSSGYCPHYVCRACLRKKRALNLGCIWCLDFSKLKRSDEQIGVVVACYKLLCKAMKSSCYYINSEKNPVIDNLLKEANLHADVLPNSSFLVQNNSRILNGKMAVKAISQLNTCAREKADTTSAGNDVKSGRFDIRKTREIMSNGISESCGNEANEKFKTSTMKTVEDKNDESTVVQPNVLETSTEDTKYTNCNNQNGVVGGEEGNEEKNEEVQEGMVGIKVGSTVVKSLENEEQNFQVTPFQPHANLIETGLSNIDTSTNNHLELNSVEMNHAVKESPLVLNNSASSKLTQKELSKEKRASLRPRNGQSVLKSKARRYMRKRKKIAEAHKQLPKKKYRIDLSK